MSTLEILKRFATSVDEAMAISQNESEIYADPPDGYEDALIGGIMVDPVRVRGMANICERSTYMQSILTTGTDPYTRQPLAARDLEAVPELAEEIRAWKLERLQAWKEAQLAAQAARAVEMAAADPGAPL